MRDHFRRIDDETVLGAMEKDGAEIAASIAGGAAAVSHRFCLDWSSLADAWTRYLQGLP